MRARLSLVLLAGCLEPEDDVLYLDERFEAVPGAPRWTVTGAVELVTTWHPAEHGLRFVTATEMVASLGITVYDEYSDGHWIEYSTNCGDAPGVRNEAQLDGTWRVVLELPVDGGADLATFERVHVTIPPLPAGDGWTPTTISSLLVRAVAGGPCVLDNLRVYQPDNPVVW